MQATFMLLRAGSKQGFIAFLLLFTFGHKATEFGISERTGYARRPPEEKTT